MNKFDTIYENFKKNEDRSNLIGKKVYHGSPGYPMEAKIKEINSEKNGIEIVLSDDSFYNLSKNEWEKFKKTGKWSTTKWNGNGHAMIALDTVYKKDNNINEQMDDSLKEIIKKIKDATASNNHTEALILLYRDIFKNKKKAKELEKIKDENMETGYAGDVSKKIYEKYYKPAMERVKKQFNKDVYEKIHDAF